MRNTDIKNLEESAVEKYQDVCDTILVIETMKADTKKGEDWKALKAKLSKNV